MSSSPRPQIGHLQKCRWLTFPHLVTGELIGVLPRNHCTAGNPACPSRNAPSTASPLGVICSKTCCSVRNSEKNRGCRTLALFNCMAFPQALSCGIGSVRNSANPQVVYILVQRTPLGLDPYHRLWWHAFLAHRLGALHAVLGSYNIMAEL